MILLNEYKQNFEPHEVPDALVKLVEFDNERRAFFSSGFELAGDDKGGLKTYSDKREFLECLYPIGQANASGSTYAIWRRTGSLGDAPIVAFGDEGGAHIVAANLAELLRILTLDASPMIDWESITYFKDEDNEPSERAADYASWLAEYLKLKPVAGIPEAEEIVADAQNLYSTEFRAWMKKYFAE
jgi:hypothetical protein